MARKPVFVAFSSIVDGRLSLTFIQISPMRTDYQNRAYVMAVSDTEIVHCFVHRGSVTPNDVRGVIEKWHPGKWRIWQK